MNPASYAPNPYTPFWDCNIRKSIFNMQAKHFLFILVFNRLDLQVFVKHYKKQILESLSNLAKFINRFGCYVKFIVLSSAIKCFLCRGK
jgi:hypothetical protein